MAEPEPAPSAEPEDGEGDPGPYFCFCCEDAGVTRSDEDRCCLMCGMDLIPLSQLKETVAKIGLTILPTADVPSPEERQRAADAIGLWWYWRDHDITEDSDRWADFTNAVYDMLDGKPVPQKWIGKAQRTRRAAKEGK